MSAVHGPKIVLDNLVLCLDANNSRSYPGTGNTWYDLSGNNNHATLRGNTSYITWSTNGYFQHRPTGYFGAADSNSSAPDTGGAYWTIDDSLELRPSTSGWTVNGWLKVIGDQTVNGTGWFHKQGSGDERGIHLEPIGGTFRANGINGWSQIDYDINNSGLWQNFCFTFNQTSGTYGSNVGELIFYINGVEVTRDSDFTPTIDGGAIIQLMRRNGHLRHFLNGDVANYYYYTKTLTSNEVKSNYDALALRYSSI